jgi:hypothetical protein
MRQKSMSTDELKSPGKENDASGSDDETEASEPQPRVNGTLSRAGPANENEQITCASISSSSSSKVHVYSGRNLAVLENQYYVS